MPDEVDYIKVKRTATATKLSGLVNGFRYTDEDTGMEVIFIPSLDISGYGKTTDEAQEMTTEALNSYLKGLVKLPVKAIKNELVNLGWSSEQFHTKVFHPNFDPKEKLKEDGIHKYETTSIPIAA